MLKKMISIILVILFCSSSLAQDKKNILEINGDEIFFSIGGYLNWDYYKIHRHSYEKIISKYYLDNTKHIKNNPFNGTINVELPDSLYENHFMIQKGYLAVKMDSIDMNPFILSGFKTTLDDAYGPKVIISIPESISYYDKDLFMISPNSSTINQISTFNPTTVQNNEVQEKVRTLLVEYFNDNRTILNHQLYYRNLIPDTLNNEQFKAEINSRLELIVFELEKNCFCVSGLTLDNENLPFFGIVYTNENKIILASHTKVFNFFKISNDYYFYCWYCKPASAIQSYSVLKLEADKLKTIFSDGSYTM